MKILAYYRGIKALLNLYIIKTFGNLKKMEFSYYNHFGYNVSLKLDKGASVHFGKNIGLRDNVCISCRKGSIIELNDNVFLNNGCQVVAHEKIIIGKNVKIGPYTCFFDHDYDYRAYNGVKEKKFKTAPIIVGEGTWIGSGCIILRGTVIGKNCVIAAGSIVKGRIEDNCLFIKR